MPQIEVAFDIDANGILHVSATDLGTGKEQKIRIESSSGLSPAEVERMEKEAASHADEDKKKRELIDAKNKADQMIWQMEKLLKDNADKLSEGDKAPIQSAIERVKQAVSGNDLDSINRAIQDLEQASHAMAQHLYSRQGPTPGGAPGEASPEGGDGQTKGKDDVIDAEFEVKK
jgi:molecular chaperone DnaK